MGIFDKMKSQDRQIQSADHSPQRALLEIVRVVCFEDAKIMESARQCVENTADYYKDHIDDYQDRGLSDQEETSFLQWIGCIDLLLNNNYICECDWKEGKEEFVYAISSLHGIASLSLQIDGSWFDEEQSVPQWCKVLEEKWKQPDCVMAAFDIDSDSYVMFPCKKNDIEALQSWAEHVGYRIDHAKNM